ncbi:hypothetical protein OP10G_1684 [Fimbriimonas ginsengisoli Gsoil 348]|uniref:Uncharacterized protein n=2 Tax=Fimbriimonas ginsengisoli TaxID=1005039 RepID=A0A068NNV7_FIMGI|nr:hypothetical protein OP10G_1684 [Fimbriimonas ginsengisoli Gsoil 348]
MAKLGPPVLLDEYKIRPPKGYLLSKEIGSDGSTTYSWMEPHHRGLGSPALMLMVLKMPAGVPHESREEISQETLQGLLRHLRNGHMGQTEVRDVGGLEFLRTYFKGKDRSAKPSEGYQYVAVDGNNALYFFLTRTVDRSTLANFRIMEAAVLSVRK